MPRTLNPSSEAVAVAFLKLNSTLPTDKIATVLPGNAAAWAESGFVQVRTVGGSPNRDIPQAEPVLTIDCWANSGASKQMNWGLANDLAERVRRELQDNNEFFGDRIDPGANYKYARVISAWAITEPRRVEGDPNNYARYTFDVEIHWAVIND